MVAAVAALLLGAGGTVAVERLVSQAPAATRAVQAVSLPGIGRAAQAAPDFRLPDQNGQMVSLSSLRGREVLVTFMDPTCTSLCPIMGQQLGSVEAKLPAGVEPVLLVVRVAPNRTPADVAGFVSHVTWRPGWHWLLGDQAQLQAVWTSWQVNVLPTTGDVAHDEVVFIVNPKGQMVAGYNAPLGITEVASMITRHSTR